MKYNFLGNTGLAVSELCMGTMTFGGQGYWSNIGNLKQDSVNELIGAAVAGGINFFDTANVYSYGESESLLGQSLIDLDIKRDNVVIATKLRGRMGEGVNNVGLSRYHIMNSINDSLTRLQMDHVDVLYVHGVDPVTPLEETMRALNDIVVAGKVRYLGVCNWPAWMVMKAIAICEKNGWNRFWAMQYFYSIGGRDIEREIVPFAKDQGLGIMPWSPLAGGFFSGKFSRTVEKAGDSRRDNFDFPPINKSKAFDIIDCMADIAKDLSVSVAEVALAWVRMQNGITTTIIGAKTVEQLHANIRSTELTLNEVDMSKLNDLSALTKEYPGWMVERQGSDRIAPSSIMTVPPVNTTKK